MKTKTPLFLRTIFFVTTKSKVFAFMCVCSMLFLLFFLRLLITCARRRKKENIMSSPTIARLFLCIFLFYFSRQNGRMKKKNCRKRCFPSPKD
jgi:hypothetical protein